ncbi:Lrp/AsnC family transcriptional regulator [Sandaracinobacteroides saxicola]|uniref:Lrp/AsnC family transcriptional regulator n=1 Tax=Sandaracinobacteroides saxicola TaxID=2759707 RepID=A0A7G5IJK8_9SPHN|nr:Lrp/AsnC family transcriptional regulator [Sandaracinobacteroides saxicola]QMW23550.1 Lrp/AsnC family transcriptional regulator [Sandaracinobacteroides saxicola]
MDRIDRRILLALQNDGRMTNAALAERVALSPSACLARVRALEEAGVIAGYRAVVAVEKIRPALTIYGEVTLKRHLPEDFAAVEAMLRGEPRVLEAAEISGKSDYLVTCMVADMAEWRAMTAEWTAGPWQIERVTSSVAMHRTKAFAGFPLG